MQLEDALTNGEPVIILQDDTPQVQVMLRSKLSTVHYLNIQPVYVVTDVGDPEEDPLIEELADELEAEAELRDHISELSELVHERYGV